MEITVTQDGIEIASGDLEVDTSTRPPTGTFTPDGGMEVPALVSSWSAGPTGPANWNFQVSGSANGDFPLGKNGTPFTYVFTGHQNPNGPSGVVTWPTSSIEGGDTVEWQGGATIEGEDEPYAQGQGAS